MRHLYLFNPDNDLALGRDLANYTPPPAAANLRVAGACLPLWYGADGDEFVATGVNGRWLSGVCDTFGIGVDVYDHVPADKMPTPWGWSRATRTDFRRLGFSDNALPTDSALEAIRALSHRRSTAELHRLLPPGLLVSAPVEVSEWSTLEEFLATHPRAMLKLPYSSSGRGLAPVDRDGLARRRAEIEGMVRRQGSVMAEPWVEKCCDFALLYNMEVGRARAAGISLFETDANGNYTGNILAPEGALRAQVAAHCDPTALATLETALPRALEALIGENYEGPLGVDFIAEAGSGRIAMCEMNLRMTMGHFATLFHRLHCVSGTEGRFAIANQRPGGEATVANGKFAGGILPLNPPGEKFVFYAQI